MKKLAISVLIMIAFVGCQTDDTNISTSEVSKAPETGVERIFELEEVDQAPRPIAMVPPKQIESTGIPKDAITVVVEFVVTQDGTVKSASSDSEVDAVFIEKAIAAVEKWKFEPAQKDGNPVNCRVRVPLPMQFGNN
jgi:TonB family protein